MKRAGLFLALLLASCAPSLLNPAPTPDPTPATVSVVASPQHVRFAVGTMPATLNSLRVFGTDLRVNDDRCAAEGDHLLCAYGVDVPAGYAFGLPIGGSNIVAEARYHRADLTLHCVRSDGKGC